MPKRGRCYSMGWATGPVAEDEKRFMAAEKISAGDKGEQNEVREFLLDVGRRCSET